MTDVSVAPSWVCVGCRARVELAADSCTSCGRPFGLGLETPSTGRRTHRLVWLVRELVVLNVLFVLWRIVGRVSLLHAAGAFARGRWIWHAERVMHLPSEAAMQRAVLPHDLLARVCNGYYAYAHVAVLAAVLLWLLLRHREAYPRWRNLVVVFTAASLLIGLLPVSPPRLVPSLHLVDLAARYHQSVYDGIGKGITDQLSAMPSVHVGWAVVAAAAVVAAGRSRWRWLAVLHPVVTAYVVVVTANHYWLDGVAAVLLLTVLVAVARRIRPGLVP